MIERKIILDYLHWACEDLLLVGKLGFAKRKLRPTQREALIAYKRFLERTDLSDEEKLSGYFEIPTGVGKTALFGALIERVLIRARADKVDLRVGIVAPRINLLTQTQKAFIELAHWLKYKIGLYGGGDRILSRPITIMTYESWANLTDQGKLSGDDFDILISDEAHRGTSVAREERLASYYDGIVRLAFTATAHFDTTKSVINTHRNNIFEKHIPASIEDGELTAYVQTQTYVVRVAPEKAAKDRSVAKRLIRQVAFNKFVEKRLVVGRDTQTGDLLTDNQGGIFVTDTAQANLLERKLNTNPELQRRARERGCKAFAVAIHSIGISAAEQKQREKDYAAGKYLYVISDEKFKEGADYPQMKTIIDSMHGSLVDKAQILGRGARRWRNLFKRRQEGLAFLDPIIYIGSDDPKVDKRLRAEAIARSILAADILDGRAYVGDPHFPAVEIDGDPEPRDRDEDIDITSYTSPASVRIFLSERDRLREAFSTIENWPWSDEYKALCELRERKGNPGYKILFSIIKKDVEARGLFSREPTYIDSIIKGKKQSVEKRQIAALTRLLREMPDKQLAAKIENWPKSQEYEALRGLFARKGMPGCVTLFKMVQADHSIKGLFHRSPIVIEQIVKGRKLSVEYRQAVALIRILEKMPDKQLGDKIANWSSSKEYEALRALLERKGRPGSVALFKLAEADNAVKGLLGQTYVMLEQIIKGKKQYVERQQIEALTQLLEKMPDKQLPAKIENWPESDEYKALRALLARKGNPGCVILFKIAEVDDLAKGLFGLSNLVIEQIIKGEKLSVECQQVTTLIRLLEGMPDKALVPRKDNWPESPEYKKLRALWESKGNPVGGVLFNMAEARKETKGLFGNRSCIERMLSGKMQSVKLQQVEALTQLLSSMLDKPVPKIIKDWPNSSEYRDFYALLQRKGNPGYRRLFRLVRAGADELFGNAANNIASIIKGKKFSVDQRQIEVLSRILEKMPDAKPTDKPEMRQASRVITKRTWIEKKSTRPVRESRMMGDRRIGGVDHG